MIIGRKKLLEMYPNFKNDIAENGIDLRVGKIQEMVIDNKVVGCVDDQKMLPNLKDVEFNPVNKSYELKPFHWYFVTIDRKMNIPDGYTQIYLLRSTFTRCGLMLGSSVGDNGYNGTLMMTLFVACPQIINIGKNERIIQALTIKNDGTATKYNGDYQNDDIYKE